MFGLFQARLTKEQRWGSALLSRNHSLEEEFERAKAAVEVIAFKIVSLLHVAQSEIKKIYIKLQEATHKWVLLYRRDCLNETCYQRTSDFPSGLANRCHLYAIYGPESWVRGSSGLRVGPKVNLRYASATPLCEAKLRDGHFYLSGIYTVSKT